MGVDGWVDHVRVGEVLKVKVFRGKGGWRWSEVVAGQARVRTKEEPAVTLQGTRSALARVTKEPLN